jgi:hypothetical protein
VQGALLQPRRAHALHARAWRQRRLRGMKSQRGR